MPASQTYSLGEAFYWMLDNVPLSTVESSQCGRSLTGHSAAVKRKAFGATLIFSCNLLFLGRDKYELFVNMRTCRDQTHQVTSWIIEIDLLHVQLEQCQPSCLDS